MILFFELLLNLKTHLKQLVVTTIGIDRDVYWTLINTLFQIVRGPLSVFFIVSFLTPEQQGTWYTFLSLGGMSIFAELGFTRIITRFVSHEYAYVHIKEGVITGPQKNIDSLFSLIRYSIRFYSVIIPAAIIILIATGYYFFYNHSVTIFKAWVVFSVIMGFQLLGGLFQSVFQGLDKVAEIMKNLVWGSLLTSLFNWFLLAIGANIWALVIGNAVGFLIMIVMLYKIAPSFWRQLKTHECQYKFSWFGKMMPLQWRYAISFTCGYIASQGYIPAIYKIEGPIAAGQFGLTFLIMNTLISGSSAWLTSKTPKLNIMVASGEYNLLIQLFKKSVLRGYLVYIFGAASALAFIWMLNHFNVYNDRFLTVRETGILLLCGMATINIGFIAEYVRAYKVEPFYVLSIIGCIIALFLIFFVLPKFGLFIFLIFVTGTTWFISLPIATFIFMTYLQFTRKRVGS